MALSYSETVQQLLWLGHEGRSLKWDLANIRAVLERLGHPEQRFPSVHIAGTNGKGSVAAMTASILRTAGYRTGLYSSPHLVRINERIVVNGGAVSDEEFAAAFDAITEPIEALLAENVLPNYPSYFECLTAMALWHFAQAEVDTAVLEVGLGGRLDATNIVTPEVAAITAIDFDHERYLGYSIEQIAAEKAGIIKPGVPVVSAATHPVAREVVAKRAAELGAPLVDVEADYSVEEMRTRDLGRYKFVVRRPDGFSLSLAPSLRGAFQVQNALVAVAVALLIVPRALQLLKEALDILLEGTPSGVEFERVAEAMVAVPGVERVHDLHIWSVTSGFVALSGHVLVADPGEQRRVLLDLRRALAEEFGIDHVTIQIETADIEATLGQPCLPDGGNCFGGTSEREFSHSPHR